MIDASPSNSPSPVPLTVVGGYLGAGKTTLVNALLRDPGGRRLGVVVNDFGPLAIDAERLAGAEGAGVVSLPNGCVCCTLGSDLRGALRPLLDLESPPDHIVVEVSGVADPAATAAWGTVAPFEPGGTIVLADADAVARHARDRYVGGEVVRQLVGADLLVVTKSDLVSVDHLAATEQWLERTAPGVPRVVAVSGDVPVDVVLGLRPGDPLDTDRDDVLPAGHHGRYVSWSWASTVPVARPGLDRFVGALPPAVLRLKGSVHLDDTTAVDVDVVGARREVRRSRSSGGCAERRGSRLVAIALRREFDLAVLDELAAASLGSG